MLASRKFLKKSIETQRLSHAYLFSGPEGAGKKETAREWAEFLLKIDPGRRHPDLILVEPGPEASEIKIAQIRDLIWKLSLRPYAAPFKIAVIDQAHLMTREAQNCLLKTLEEPTATTILILISEFPEALLPTISSRCQQIKFPSLSESDLEKSFEKSAGLRQGILEMPKKDLAARFQYAKSLAEDNNLQETLKAWQFFFRRLFLKNLRAGSSVGKLKNILVKIQYIFFLIRNTNINQRLALEILMLEL